MRRLLSFHRSYTPPVGGGARLSPYLLPPPLFLGFSHRQSRVPVGLGRCRSSAPACFLEVMRVEMTHEEMDALLQRYDGLPVPMQAMIDSMVAEMVSGLDPDSEMTEWAARFWTAVLVRMALEAGGGADAFDSE
jgi:hypothetical protein